jgi:DNA-binding PadR family transcriptional regulator
MKDYSDKTLKAKACYGHLGGTLGNRLFERLLELDWFEREEGTSTVYRLTETGKQEFARLGVDFMKRG